jgi:hypothetical protein
MKIDLRPLPRFYRLERKHQESFLVDAQEAVFYLDCLEGFLPEAYCLSKQLGALVRRLRKRGFGDLKAVPETPIPKTPIPKCFENGSKPPPPPPIPQTPIPRCFYPDDSLALL